MHDKSGASQVSRRSLVGAGLAVACASPVWCLHRAPPRLRTRGLKSATIELYWRHVGGDDVPLKRDEIIRVVSADVPAILNLIEIIHRGQRGEPHKCPTMGKVRFAYSDGTSREAGITPGHVDSDYEVAVDGPVRVDRKTFFSALAALGVNPDDTPR
jgi:hypothetical protein